MASPAESQSEFNLMFAYSDFWRHSPGRVYAFSFEELGSKTATEVLQVRPLLERAAVIVESIRRTLTLPSDLDAGVRRRIDGAAHEYLSSLKKNPNRHPDRFIRNLVHATFRNTAGYVEGLSHERVDAFITELTAENSSLFTDKIIGLLSNIAVAWGKACHVLGGVLGQEPAKVAATLSRSDVPKLDRLLLDLQAFTHSACFAFHTVPIDSESVQHKSSHADRHSANKNDDATAKTTLPSTSELDPPLLDTASKDTATRAASVGARRGTDVITAAPVAITATKDHTMDVTKCNVTAGVSLQQSSANPKLPVALFDSVAPDSIAAAASALLPQTTHGFDSSRRKLSDCGTYSSSDAELNDDGSSSLIRGHGASMHGSYRSDETFGALPPFEIAIKTAEMDISDIHKELVALSDVLALPDTSDALHAQPKVGRDLVKALFKRCREFMETLSDDMIVITDLHLPASVEDAQIAHLQDAAKEVVEATRRLACLSVILKDEQVKMQTRRSSHGEAADGSNEKQSYERAIARVQQGQHCASGDCDVASSSCGLSNKAEEANLSEPGRVIQAALRVPARRESEGALVAEMKSWFRELKLEPRVDIHEESEAFVLQMFVPDVRQEDVGVNVHDDMLVIKVLPKLSLWRRSDLYFKGFRGPAVAALEAMSANLPSSCQKEALLRMGIGQFGTFVEVFTIPSNVNAKAVAGSYEHGLLQVILPKISGKLQSDPQAGFMLLQNPANGGCCARRVLSQSSSDSSPARMFVAVNSADKSAATASNCGTHSEDHDHRGPGSDQRQHELPPGVKFLDPRHMRAGDLLHHMPRANTSSTQAVC